MPASADMENESGVTANDVDTSLSSSNGAYPLVESDVTQTSHDRSYRGDNMTDTEIATSQLRQNNIPPGSSNDAGRPSSTEHTSSVSTSRSHSSSDGSASTRTKQVGETPTIVRRAKTALINGALGQPKIDLKYLYFQILEIMPQGSGMKTSISHEPNKGVTINLMPLTSDEEERWASGGTIPVTARMHRTNAAEGDQDLQHQQINEVRAAKVTQTRVQRQHE